MSFEEWLRNYPNHKYIDGTIKRYIRALEKCEDWLNITLPRNILMIDNLKEYYEALNTIKTVPNFKEINFSHGHGDLSAALTLYQKYLVFINDTTSQDSEGEQIEEVYSPLLSKEEWLELLNDPDIIGPVWGGLLAAFYGAGGEASCKQLGEKYHRGAPSISGNCTNLAKAIQRKTGCPVYVQNGTEKYWYILFCLNDAPLKEDNSTVWKIRPELYDALTEFDIMRFEWPVTEEKNVSTKEALPQIENYIKSKGFSYPEGMIENFYLSLKSKPFVILAGTSGTGKTRLVKLFAEAIGAEYKLVSVRPDWSDGSDLFGHYDLNGKFIEGPVCECFEMAAANPQKPVFLCLDEMNLARVEYYLSDFLSVIESREKQEDDSILTTGIAQYDTGIPDNLYIIGTVNMDETTFPFSRKVLDRANTIDFNYVDLMPAFDDTFVAVEPLNVSNKFLRSEYLILARDCVKE